MKKRSKKTQNLKNNELKKEKKKEMKRKRGLVLILGFAMIGMFTACGGSNSTENAVEPTDVAVEITTEPITEVTAEIDTEATTETATEASSTCWEMDNYVDDFGDETDDSYIRGIFEGDFTDTAGNHDLEVIIYYDRYSTGPYWTFRLLEYGDHNATYRSNDLMGLHMKIDGQEYTTQLFGNSPNGDLFFFPSLNSYIFEEYRLLNIDDRSTVWDALGNAVFDGKTIPCYIIIGDESAQFSSVGGSKYSFKIDGSGFADLYALLD